MKAAVLADIHSNHVALEACVEEAIDRGVEEFIFLGDYLGDLAYPEKTLACLARVREAYPCTFIRGNKEDYWIDHQNGRHEDWLWEPGSSSTGMLAYVYDRLTKSQIEEFARMPISQTIRRPRLPVFTICHGSPWKANESMREDYSYIDELAERLETELTICAHFHIQCDYTRRGKRIINPGSVGVPLQSGGMAQFMILSSDGGDWLSEFVSLPYDTEKTIREMDEEKLYRQAPGWYRATKAILRGRDMSHVTVLSKASALCEQCTGERKWNNIPEEYWETALTELGI
ncbi:MAG: metallophosphoesterase family protein [Oscillospiraceae bacterium]|nr:metallophosphoesterase family protein [Oscillospiraceae bacterium]